MQEFLTPREVSPRVRRTTETLRMWRAAGIGPPWIKLNGRVLYDREDLERWIREEAAAE